MAVEREYLEYVGFFCISILSASAAYLIDLNNTTTYIGFLMIPLAFGYSAYASQENFRKASLASLMTLFLIGTKPVVSVVAITVAFGVPLISLFSNGNSFKDYFGTVAVPLLIVGLVLGGGVYAKVSYDDNARENFIQYVSSTAGNHTEAVLETTGMGGNVQEAQLQVMEAASDATVVRTSQIVQSNMTGLNATQRQKLLSSFQYARENVPATITEEAENSMNSTNVDVSQKVSEELADRLSGKYLLALIPLVGMGLYSLNPLMGVLTGFFAVLIGFISRKTGF